MVLERPKVVLKYGRCGASEPKSCLLADYQFKPLMNLFFTRDQFITTSRGIVLGRMANPQRAPEREVMKFVLRKLGIQPIYEISPRGRLEGGDFFPAGERVFIGQGLRTNAAAIDEMLTHDVFARRSIGGRNVGSFRQPRPRFWIRRLYHAGTSPKNVEMISCPRNGLTCRRGFSGWICPIWFEDRQEWYRPLAPPRLVSFRRDFDRFFSVGARFIAPHETAPGA